MIYTVRENTKTTSSYAKSLSHFQLIFFAPAKPIDLAMSDPKIES